MWRSRADVAALTGDDVGDVAQLHAGAFERAWSAEEFATLLASSGVSGWGIWRSGMFRPRRLAGFVLVRAVEDEAEVLTIGVAADCRRRGYGRRLMEEALRALYRDRVSACFLEVDGGNGSAVGLYRSLGFTEAGERKGYYAGARALIMRLALSP